MALKESLKLIISYSRQAKESISGLNQRCVNQSE